MATIREVECASDNTQPTFVFTLLCQGKWIFDQSRPDRVAEGEAI